MPETTTARLEDGTTVELGQVLARAGEGTIYTITGHPEWVAKIFHPDLKDLDSRVAKMAAMIASVPRGAVQTDGYVVLTWPQHTLTSDDGATGYVMARIDTADAVEIHVLSNPSNRLNPLPSHPQWTQHATWHHLVNVAANLCLAVDAVHQVDAVIGDFQERNILVTDTTRVTLVDCDSMQFTDGSGHQYLCTVGRPEFTAPELLSVDLSTTPRQKSSDLFALAVHIHLLLMAGNHPFMRGTWRGNGEQPDSVTLARTGQWAGGTQSALHTHPVAPPVTFLPADIQALFERAFTAGAHNPAARPTAAEWRRALLAVTVRTCPREQHQIPATAIECPWCRIDDTRAHRRNQQAIKITAPPNAPHPATMPAAPTRRISRGWLTTLILTAAAAIIAITLVITNGLNKDKSSAFGGTGNRPGGGGTQQILVSPLDRNGNLAPGWTIEPTTSVDSPLDCNSRSFNTVSSGVYSCPYLVGGGLMGLYNCWPLPHSSDVLCVTDLRIRTAQRYPAQLSTASSTTLPAQPAIIVLDDGLACREIYRMSVERKGTPYASAYSAYECNMSDTYDKNAPLVWADENTSGSSRDTGINRSGRTWTVQIGTTTGPISTAKVSAAYFATG